MKENERLLPAGKLKFKLDQVKWQLF